MCHPQWPNNGFYSFIFIFQASNHHLALCDKSNIISNMAPLHRIKRSTCLLQFALTATGFHLSVSLSFPLRALIGSEQTEMKKKKNPWCQATLAKGHTPSSHYSSQWILPSYLSKTKTVVRGTVICLHCQLCYLEYSGLTTQATDTLPFLPLRSCILSCQSTQRPFPLRYQFYKSSKRMAPVHKPSGISLHQILLTIYRETKNSLGAFNQL